VLNMPYAVKPARPSALICEAMSFTRAL